MALPKPVDSKIVTKSLEAQIKTESISKQLLAAIYSLTAVAEEQQISEEMTEESSAESVVWDRAAYKLDKRKLVFEKGFMLMQWAWNRKTDLAKLAQGTKTLKEQQGFSEKLKGMSGILENSNFISKNLKQTFDLGLTKLTTTAEEGKEIAIAGGKVAKEVAKSQTIDTSKVVASLKTIKDTGKEQLKKTAKGGMVAIEKEREEKRFNKGLLAAIKGLRGNASKEGDSIWERIFIAVTLGIAALSTWFGSFFTAINNQLLLIAVFFKTSLGHMAKYFKFFGRMLLKPFKNMKFAQNLQKAFGTMGNLIQSKLLQPLKEIVKHIKGKIVGGTQTVAEFFGRIAKFLDKFPRTLGKFSFIFKAFGSVARFAPLLGRLFLPFTFILGAINVVKGFMKGFKEDGFLGGIIGAIDGLYDFLIDQPLNLIKNIVSFLLRKFGMDAWADKLDSFEFDISGFISGIYKTLISWVGGLFGMDPLKGAGEIPLPAGEGSFNIGEMLSSLWTSVSDWFVKTFTWEHIKASLSSAVEWSPAGILLKVLTKLGEWFGEFLNIDFTALGKWLTESMGSMGSSIAGFFGGAADSEAAAEGRERQKGKQKFGREQLNNQKNLILEQSKTIKNLNDQIETLKGAGENARAAGGGTTVVKQGDSVSGGTNLNVNGTPAVINSNGDASSRAASGF